MIKFFKNIRKALLNNKKFRKYLIYGIGEIVLVVIGILLALAINNYNENKKNKNKSIANLREIQKNLIEDVKSSEMIKNSYLETYFRKKEIFDFQSPLTIEDFENGLFPKIGEFANHFVIDRSGYQNLMNHIDDLPHEFLFLLNDFRTLYIDNSSIIDIYNAQLLNTVNSHQNFLSHQDWEVYSMKYGIKSKDEIDYYINNYKYKNYVLKYINDKKNIFLRSQLYRIIAIKTYKKIDSLLKIDESNFPEYLLNSIKTKDYEGKLGIYQYKGKIDGERFFIMDNKLCSNYYNGTQVDFSKSLLIHRKMNDSLFITLSDKNPDLWQFNKNKKSIIHLGSDLELIKMD
ncbi:hypothetical protein FPF71_14185 [Algibacter amylolyticus]|uniref:Uncharacterized protein n=1 Tax=Algibacter amylolyticus TaxID=1608400 RepID=A0A5M7B1V5_9FLAO|nr:DUF6090 family protein [Algibacter amylolyticus]KAA5822298.1 hypothetical protein F2B50_14185 [Algibacter amylolyticus]MBB5269010.1 hypothetical protein [Algibacter amylolyticus]TSJ73448.1 hypothetical protein FPF71_14185 [Algibacter amylolyticus]